MKLEDLEIYNLSMDLSDKIWEAIRQWDYFAKDTIDKQWCRATDSVSANISEGFGRNSTGMPAVSITSPVGRSMRAKPGWINPSGESSSRKRLMMSCSPLITY